MLIRSTAALVDALGEGGWIAYGPTLGNASDLKWATVDGHTVHRTLVRQLEASGELEPIAWGIAGEPIQFRMARLGA